MRTISLHIGAIRDGATTFIVDIDEPATGHHQTIEGVVADSEEDAIHRVVAILERNAKAAMGDTVHVTMQRAGREGAGG